MTEAETRPTKPNPSPWPFAAASFLLFVLTACLMALHGRIDGGIRRTEMRLRVETDRLTLENGIEGTGVKIPQERLDRLEDALGELEAQRETLAGPLSYYPVAGVLSFFCSVIAVMRKPRAVGIWALLFGLLGLWLALVQT